MGHDLELNKQNAIAFYQTAYLGEPSKAVESYVGAEYIQHNPLVGDGKQAFIDFVWSCLVLFGKAAVDRWE